MLQTLIYVIAELNEIDVAVTWLPSTNEDVEEEDTIYAPVLFRLDYLQRVIERQWRDERRRHYKNGRNDLVAVLDNKEIEEEKTEVMTAVESNTSRRKSVVHVSF